MYDISLKYARREDGKWGECRIFAGNNHAIIKTSAL